MNIDALQEVILAISEQRTVDAILLQITEHLGQALRIDDRQSGPLTSEDALVRIWLIEPGDQCAICNHRQVCPDQRECLHLVASAGKLKNPREEWRRLDVLDETAEGWSRAPLGVTNIGMMAKSGGSIATDMMEPGPGHDGLPDWGPAEGVVSFTGRALVYRKQVQGVLAVFSRRKLADATNNWLRLFANHAAVAIGNARAFTEIERLRLKLEQENLYLREEVSAALGAHDIIGDSPGLKKVLQQIQLVAPTDAAVLITGESGTGKELVARALHEGSPRKDRALIKVNCGAVPETLFESEFFGHVRGAFTGAMKDKPGRFELADGGTLFLDEIGEVPLPMQAKLLRVLQEQEIERVGDTRTRKINVRIIAATNRDLKKEAEAGRFRQDLFYRLSVFPIEIPPLRERRDDIAPLATHFVKQAARRMNRPTPRVTQATLSQLTAHGWAGNVRELQNAVERAVILSQRGPLQFDLAEAKAADSGKKGKAVSPTAGVLTRDELKRQERESIAAALEQAGGKVFGVGGAAELLGMRPTTLASRIKALGIRRRRD
ncbi:MAG: sigma 54-interacting transcriptional regulator [Limisphaerales bacterium]